MSEKQKKEQRWSEAMLTIQKRKRSNSKGGNDIQA